MPTTGLINFTLAGTAIGFDRADATISLSDLQITDRLGEIPNVASCRVRGRLPLVGQEVIGTLSGSSERIFAGHVIAVHQASIAKYTDLAFDLQCIDYTWLLNRRKVTKRYTSTTAGAVLSNLVSTFTSGFTATAVETAAGNTAIDEITFTQEEFTQAVTRLAKRIGAYWYCDYTKDIHFFFSETGSNPTALSLSHPSLDYQSVRVSMDLSQAITRVKMEGNGSTAVGVSAVGARTLPIVDETFFNPAGGTVVSGAQEITYTGIGSYTQPSGSWQVLSSMASGAYSACVWSPDLGLFCAVGPSGAVATSPDGVTWTARTAAAANTWADVCWSPELDLFVAVSTDGANRVMTSPDGITWTSRSAAAANQWQGVCWAAGLTLFVAVSADGASRVMTSPDGITWTSRTAAAARTWQTVCWSQDLTLLVAVANQSGTDSVMTSPDGITWTSRTHSTMQPRQVVWADTLGRFVAGGNTQFMYSADGTTWTLSTFTNSGRTWVGLIWARELGLLIATASEGVNDTVVVSTDGDHWSVQSKNSTSSNWYSPTWSPTLGVIVAVNSTSSTSVLVSVGDLLPALTGIPASGAGSIVTDIAAGDDVNLLVTVNDTAAQTALAALVGGDGITEDYLQDRRLSEAEATARATAHLNLRKNPEIILRYRCRDILTKSGRTISVPGWVDTTNVVGAWALHERAGTVSDDLTDGNHNGTYVGSPTLGVTGPTSDMETGVTLNGSSQYITMGDISTYEFVSAFSVQCWVKTTSGSGQAIVSKADGSSKGWRVVMNASGTISFQALTSAAATVFNITTTGAYNDGQWHHVVCTWDGTTGANKVQIYVDGSVVKQGTASAGTPDANAEPFLIGAQSSSFLVKFTGSLMKVAVYNAELSSTQVATLYAQRRWTTGYLGDLTIQDVTISEFSQKNPNLFPTYDVQASSTRFSFEDLLRRVPREPTIRL